MDQQNQQPQNFSREQEQAMLAEILEHTRKTKNYMKWQLIITVALVVIPLLAMAFAIPLLMNSLGSIYGPSTGLTQ